METALITTAGLIFVAIISAITTILVRKKPVDPTAAMTAAMNDRFRLFYNQVQGDRTVERYLARQTQAELRAEAEKLRQAAIDWGVERQHAQRTQSEMRVEINELRSNNSKLSLLIARLEQHCAKLEAVLRSNNIIFAPMNGSGKAHR